MLFNGFLVTNAAANKCLNGTTEVVVDINHHHTEKVNSYLLLSFTASLFIFTLMQTITVIGWCALADKQISDATLKFENVLLKKCIMYHTLDSSCSIQLVAEKLFI